MRHPPLSQGVYDFGRFQVFELAGELRVQGQAAGRVRHWCSNCCFSSANIRTESSPSLSCTNACGARRQLATTIRLWCTSIAFGNASKQTLQSSFSCQCARFGIQTDSAWQHITDMSIRRKLLTRFIGMLTGTVILIILLGSLAAFWVLQKLTK